MSSFQSLTSKGIIEKMKYAKEYIILLTPGLNDQLANMLTKLSKVNIEVIIDSDPECCRLGYGELTGIEILMGTRIKLRKASSLRIGVLIVDAQAWIFTPTPLIVEDDNEDTINAITVTLDQARHLVKSICPELSDDSKQLSLFTEQPEIAQQIYTSKDMDHARNDLQDRPPRKFDFERSVRTYNSYVQFVELTLKGISLSRRTISIPTKFMNIRNSKELQERLKTTYKLIDERSKVSSKNLEDKVAKIRKKYLRSMGSRLGMVILRSKKEDFNKEVEGLKNDIKKFKSDMQEKLSKHIAKTKNELTQAFTPSIIRNPPTELETGITGKVTKEIARLYLEKELDQIIPSADQVIMEMIVYCDFKDITYEMLNDEEFQKKLREQYPFVEWPKPYEEQEVIPVLF